MKIDGTSLCWAATVLINLGTLAMVSYHVVPMTTLTKADAAQAKERHETHLAMLGEGSVRLRASTTNTDSLLELTQRLREPEKLRLIYKAQTKQVREGLNELNKIPSGGRVALFGKYGKLWTVEPDTGADTPAYLVVRWSVESPVSRDPIEVILMAHAIPEVDVGCKHVTSGS